MGAALTAREGNDEGVADRPPHSQAIKPVLKCLIARSEAERNRLQICKPVRPENGSL